MTSISRRFAGWRASCRHGGERARVVQRGGGRVLRTDVPAGVKFCLLTLGAAQRRHAIGGRVNQTVAINIPVQFGRRCPPFGLRG